MERIMHDLHLWFSQHNISTESLTLILNISDRDVAAKVDMALKRDFSTRTMVPPGPVTDFSKFQMMGIRVQIESPLHEHH